MKLWSKLNRRKPIEKSLEQADTARTLHWYDLTAYGIAATVGSGLYVTCGGVAKDLAGPAVVFSTLFAGLLCLFTGICYLEFASSLPISGSSYAYAYVMLGEFLGWFVGWNLTLEYAFSAAAIAGGWTGYLVSFFEELGWKMPTLLYNLKLTNDPDSIFRINFLAAIICLLIGALVSRGIRFGAILTNLITMVNIGIIIFIVGVGSLSVKVENWTPFVPLGWSKVFAGTGQMFFSYIGYDTISSLAADAINPARDLPISMLLTVAVTTLLYMGAGLVLTGMQNYTQLDPSNPLSKAFFAVGRPWASYLVTVCALLTMSATMFACLVGQPKIFQVIAKDGLLPHRFSRQNSAGTPIAGVFLTTLLTAGLALCLNVGTGLIDMISFGTLLGMSIICAGLLVVRFEQYPPVKALGISTTILYFIGAITTTFTFTYASTLAFAIVGSITMGIPFIILCALFILYKEPLASTSPAFSCPLMPLLPCIAVASNVFMMLQMQSLVAGFSQFAIWTAIGLAIYFGYGIQHSQLGLDEEKPLANTDH